MNSTFIHPNLKEILRGARDDEEIAASISFVNQQAARRFAHLANQVVFDTTLNIDFGEEDITEKLRHHFSKEVEDLNLQVQGNSISATLPRELLEAIDQRGEDLGVSTIKANDNEKTTYGNDKEKTNNEIKDTITNGNKETMNIGIKNTINNKNRETNNIGIKDTMTNKNKETMKIGIKDPINNENHETINLEIKDTINNKNNEKFNNEDKEKTYKESREKSNLESWGEGWVVSSDDV